MLSEVAPAVSIAARLVAAPTVKACHELGWITSLDVVAVTLELPSVTKAALAPVL